MQRSPSLFQEALTTANSGAGGARWLRCEPNDSARSDDRDRHIGDPDPLASSSSAAPTITMKARGQLCRLRGVVLRRVAERAGRSKGLGAEWRRKRARLRAVGFVEGLEQFRAVSKISFHSRAGLPGAW